MAGEVSSVQMKSFLNGDLMTVRRSVDGYNIHTFYYIIIMFLIYSPDGTNVYGSTRGEIERG